MGKAFYWTMIASIIVLPVWLLFGRALFGAPLGTALVGQALLAPLLALLIAAVVGVTIARKEVRGPRAATTHDMLVVGPWLLAIALLAMFVVDEAAGREGSALTALFGDGALTASASIAALLTFAVIIAGIVIIGTQVVLLMRETRTRVTSYLGGIGATRITATEARFEPLNSDAPGRGQTLRIDPVHLERDSEDPPKA